MDFIDWRKSPKKIKIESEQEKTNARRLREKAFQNYVDAQIREAQEQGKFDNLAGAGKPLQLDINPEAGDKALGYHVLKSNGYVPAEIELLKEIRAERKRIDAKLENVLHQRKTLVNRRIPPFASEKRAFNTLVEKTEAEYEKALRDLNRKLLTFNLSTPLPMHQPLIQIEKQMQAFHEACPLLDF